MLLRGQPSSCIPPNSRAVAQPQRGIAENDGARGLVDVLIAANHALALSANKRVEIAAHLKPRQCGFGRPLTNEDLGFKD